MRMSSGKAVEAGNASASASVQNRGQGEKSGQESNNKTHKKLTSQGTVETGGAMSDDLSNNEEIGRMENTVPEKLDEEEGLEHNITHVSKTADLSPRHSNTLTAKRGKSVVVPLQVQTRSNKGRAFSCK